MLLLLASWRLREKFEEELLVDGDAIAEDESDDEEDDGNLVR